MRQSASVYSIFIQVVTIKKLYTRTMAILFIFKPYSFLPLLSVNATIGSGFLWCIALFLFCFIGVHALRFFQKLPPNLEKRLSAEKPLQENSKQGNEKQTPQPNAKPVYYIVERKQRRKPRYGDAKEIHFE